MRIPRAKFPPEMKLYRANVGRGEKYRGKKSVGERKEKRKTMAGKKNAILEATFSKKTENTGAKQPGRGRNECCCGLYKGGKAVIPSRQTARWRG